MRKPQCQPGDSDRPVFPESGPDGRYGEMSLVEEASLVRTRF